SDSHNLRPPAVIIAAPLRCWRKPFQSILIENLLRDRIRRTIVPRKVVIMIELDGRDGAFADIRAAPSSGFSEKLGADLEIRMLHALRHEVDALLVRNSHRRCSL